MKKVFFKISSFFMALLVLLSTFSFVVDQHYCGDILVDFSLFGKAESCGMDMPTSHNSNDQGVDRKGCCENQTLAIAGQDDLKVSFENLSLEQQNFVVSLIYTYINSFEGFDEDIVAFEDYSPPPLIRDIQILDQTFLI